MFSAFSMGGHNLGKPQL